MQQKVQLLNVNSIGQNMGEEIYSNTLFNNILRRVGKQIKNCSRHSLVIRNPNMCYLCNCEYAVVHVSEKKYQSHTHIQTVSNGMNMGLPPPYFSVLKIYIQRLSFQVFTMKTSETFQIWTKYVENKWEGN